MDDDPPNIPSPTLPGPTVATSPFNKTSADVIFRSSDKIDFYVHKLLLSLASPFFENLFSLNQSDIVTPAPSPLHSISHPIFPMTESGPTIDYILRLVYPIPEPSPPTTLVVAYTTFEASVKYQIEKITLKMKAALLTFVDSESAAVFAVACRLMLEHEASVAAAAWKPELPKLGIQCPYSLVPTDQCTRGYRSSCKNHDIFGRPLTCGCPEVYGYSIPAVTPLQFPSTIAGMGFTKETERISAGSYFRLLRYFETKKLPSTFCLPPPSACVPPESVDVPLWRGMEADIILESRDGTQLPAHRLILSLVSAGEILDKLPDSAPSDGGLPVIRLDEDATTLHTLLRLCYPFVEDEGFIDLQFLALAREAATKYNIPKAVSLARELMGRQLEEHPLQMYFLAKQHGWEVDAEDATQECFDLEPSTFYESYTPEMETSPARVYYDLLERYYEKRTGTGKGEPVGATAGQTGAASPKKKKKKK
ncbi:hypothetical protein NLI96_g8814 [Meripilus lineatus]|uniref:BTB domain-containing protein n=1 Tax=Meripilus lineatus TaxID=2056292 RepID=A0AAD5YAU6_9APHY|nr:hypothetical protein NLI96_g8814 [Physisporinus lineatus]